MSHLRTISQLRHFCAFTVFVAVALFSYWPAFFSQPIWDDYFLIGENPFFRSPLLAAEAFRHWLYPFSVSTYFRPVQNVTYMVDYWFWSTNLFGYHLTNVLLHATAALLIASLFRRIAVNLSSRSATSNELFAGAAALIWLVHPIHHAAVAYTAGRADSLAAVFALAAWLLVERGLEADAPPSRMAFFIGAALSCTLALFSKEIALTWIGVFILYQGWLRVGLNGATRVRLVIGAVGIILLYAIYRQTLPDLGNTAASASAPFTSRLIQCVRALGDYFSIIIAPVNLHMERQLHIPSPALRAHSPWLHYHAMTLLPLGLLGLVGGAWLVWRQSPDRRLHQFLALWFLIGFLPISNLFPLNAPVAEHWIYMPSAALIALITRGLLQFRAPNPYFGMGLVGLMSIVLIILTHEQSRTWVSEETMFRTAISRGGDTARARANLGRVLAKNGELAGAEAVLREALNVNPENPVLRTQMTGVLQSMGRTEEALAIAESRDLPRDRRGIRPPVPWMLDSQQVRLLIWQERLTEGQEVLSAALKRWPAAWELISLQAALHASEGRWSNSIEILEGYVLENWWHRAAVVLLAQHLAQANRYDEAAEKYRLAGKLDVHDAKPWEQIAAIRTRQGKLEDALRAQMRAVRVEPEDPEQRLRLSALYATLGNEVDAFLEKEEAVRLQREQREQTSRK